MFAFQIVQDGCLQRARPTPLVSVVEEGVIHAAVSYYTDDPKLAPFNHVIAAVEAETDPATMTLKGANCEWN